MGCVLKGNEIGSWDEIHADEATFQDPADGLSFTLKKVDGARMFRGRELVPGRLAWSGLAYVLPPQRDELAYSITIGRHMTRILLIYPYFRPGHNRSAFRFPPLGLGYLASSLERNGYRPQILDCTFLTPEDAFQRAIEARADIVGVYSMVTMRSASLMFARRLRDRCDLLVAGGPLPSCDPSSFWDDFDIVVKGEGESAIVEIVQAYETDSGYDKIAGLAYRQGDRTIETPKRELQLDLDQIPFPARNLFPNRMYMDHWKKHFGYSATTVMTTRGCPFSCEFCSNAVFGTSYRERSSENVLNEVEEALALGYERIHFADDVFTLNKKRIVQICDDIQSRGMDFKWECLGRVDSIDKTTAVAMKRAGCDRIFFGIESGDEVHIEAHGKEDLPGTGRESD